MSSFGNGFNIEDYAEAPVYKRRPSYVPLNTRGPKVASNPGELYGLDPFTGNIIDGHEDSPVPEYILTKDSLRNSTRENIENQPSAVKPSSSLMAKLRSSSHREKRINEFYGSLSDPKARMTVAWKNVTYSVKNPKNKKETKNLEVLILPLSLLFLSFFLSFFFLHPRRYISSMTGVLTR